MNKAALYRQLAPEARQQNGFSVLNQVICMLILLASLTVIFENSTFISRKRPSSDALVRVKAFSAIKLEKT